MCCLHVGSAGRFHRPIFAYPKIRIPLTYMLGAAVFVFFTKTKDKIDICLQEVKLIPVVRLYNFNWHCKINLRKISAVIGGETVNDVVVFSDDGIDLEVTVTPEEDPELGRFSVGVPT